MTMPTLLFFVETQLANTQCADTQCANTQRAEKKRHLIKQMLSLLSLSISFLFVSYALSAEQADSEESAMLQANIKVQASTPLSKGEQIFKSQCAACHLFEQDAIGPKLGNIPENVSDNWLVSFISNSVALAASGDERAIKVTESNAGVMPAFSFNAIELKALIAYIRANQISASEVTAISKAEKQASQHTLEKLENTALEDPIIASSTKADFALQISPFAIVPATMSSPPAAKINKLEGFLVAGNASEIHVNQRLFVNDIRGIIYELVPTPDRIDKQNFPYSTRVLLDLREHIPLLASEPGFATGLASFTFSPNVLSDGLIYTAHAEFPSEKKVDFALPEGEQVSFHWVLSEWKFNPSMTRIEPTSQRELMRMHVFGTSHAIQMISFNPFATPSDEDYGLLYIGVGDGSASYYKKPELFVGEDKIWGKLLRIDPKGDNSKNGQYGIPNSNPYANQGLTESTLGEIYASGFRNPNVFSWLSSGELILADIGHWNIEELNIVEAGANYGWPRYEGSFIFDINGDQKKVYKYAQDRQAFKQDNFRNPALEMDHDELLAIVGGYEYSGTKVPALQNKYVFGDIVHGRIFAVETSDLIHQPFEAVDASDIFSLDVVINGEKTSISELVGQQRADIRIAQDPLGELYIMSKSNGVIWKMTNVVTNFQ
uniref:PQQ-dependent sugar dehydrogenase n=1 Tax=Ningiella ruwaisensis TaxID=2364274 RepID=UPI00109F8F6C|nr:PQQ-dependent sugar dehydrogenase [Ningiella ruwaisensis]